MTRKDYVLLAAALKAAQDAVPDMSPRVAYEQWEADCEAVADALAENNPRFDRERFLKACGVQS